MVDEEVVLVMDPEEMHLEEMDLEEMEEDVEEVLLFNTCRCYFCQ